MGAHEAGALHAPGYGGVAFVPAWLRPPADVDELLPQLWASSVDRGPDGALRVGGVDVRELAATHGTPAYVLDERDFRDRAVAFRDAFAAAFAPLGGGDVFYAGKAFLCTEVARWLAADGLGLDVCTGGELAVALRAAVPGERIGLHGNNKSDAELRRALAGGGGRIGGERGGGRWPPAWGASSWTPSRSSTASPTSPPRRESAPGSCCASPSASRPTRTSTSPRRTRTRSSGCPSPAESPPRPPAARWPGPSWSCSACTATSARRSSTPGASRSPRAAPSTCTPRSGMSTASSCRSSTSAAASASPTRA